MIGLAHSIIVAALRAAGYDTDRAEEAATWLTVLAFVTAVWIVSQVLQYG